MCENHVGGVVSRWGYIVQVKIEFSSRGSSLMQTVVENLCTLWCCPFIHKLDWFRIDDRCTHEQPSPSCRGKFHYLSSIIASFPGMFEWDGTAQGYMHV